MEQESKSVERWPLRNPLRDQAFAVHSHPAAQLGRVQEIQIGGALATRERQPSVHLRLQYGNACAQLTLTLQVLLWPGVGKVAQRIRRLALLKLGVKLPGQWMNWKAEKQGARGGHKITELIT